MINKPVVLEALAALKDVETTLRLALAGYPTTPGNKKSPWGSRCPLSSPSDLRSIAGQSSQNEVIWYLQTLIKTSPTALDIIAETLINLAKENKEQWLQIVKPSGGEDMNK